jgi:hypothetical protein
MSKAEADAAQDQSEVEDKFKDVKGRLSSQLSDQRAAMGVAQANQKIHEAGSGLNSAQQSLTIAATVTDGRIAASAQQSADPTNEAKHSLVHLKWPHSPDS